jgi:hypothetical protein
MFVVLIKDVSYSFEYVYDETNAERASKEMDHFYKSIYLKGVDKSQQFTEVAPTTEREIVGKRSDTCYAILLLSWESSYMC